MTLPIGYGDGYPRNLTNCGPVLIGKKIFTISGRVCMDQIMVDVGSAKCKPGDPVVLIGSMGGRKITVEKLAELSGTISYEIVCGLGSRVPRLYVQKNAAGRKEEIRAALHSGLSERRDFVRYSCSLPLSLSRNGDGRALCDARASDISASGLRAVSSQPLPLNEEYDVLLRSPQPGGHEVRSRCRAVWSQQSGPQTYHSGIRLVNPDLLDLCKEFAAG